jgi:hypothetical protein
MEFSIIENKNITDQLASVLAYLPSAQVGQLKTLSTAALLNITMVQSKDHYWKERSEQWFGVTLPSRNVNWKTIYTMLPQDKSITKLSDEVNKQKSNDLLNIFLDGYRTLSNKSDHIVDKDNFFNMSNKLPLNYVYMPISKFMRDIFERSSALKKVYSDAIIWANVETCIRMIKDLEINDTVISDSILNIVNTDKVEVLEELLKLEIVSKYCITTINLALDKAAELGNVNMLRILLEYPDSDPMWNYPNTNPLTGAIIADKAEAVRVLLQSNKIKPDVGDCIMKSVTLNRLTILKYLLEDSRFNPAVNNNSALITAVKYVNKDIVIVLLENPNIDPSSQDNEAIVIAGKIFDIDILAALLANPKVDPTARNNQAVINAVKHGNYDAIKILLNDVRVQKTWNRHDEATKLALIDNDQNVIDLLQSYS